LQLVPNKLVSQVEASPLFPETVQAIKVLEIEVLGELVGTQLSDAKASRQPVYKLGLERLLRTYRCGFVTSITWP